MPVTIDGTTGVTSPNFFSTGTLYENAQTISANYTISTNYNALSKPTEQQLAGVK